MQKRRLILLIFIIIGCFLHTPYRGEARDKLPPRSQMNTPQNLSAFGLIEQSFARREITLDEWALYHAYSLLDPSRLPKQYHSTEPEKCGTWVLDEIRRRWANLSNTTKSVMIRQGFTSEGTLARPTGLDTTRATDHFIVHYSVSPGDTNAVSLYDGDANGTPDYIDIVLSVIEYVWNSEISTMGYTAPPPDSMAGGDNRYDVYVSKLESGLNGYAVTERLVGDNPNSPSVTETQAYSSFLVLPNYSTGLLRVTTAHQFYHAIQDGYDVYESVWMREATATWCEDEVDDADNDNLKYLFSWFDAPEYPLDASNFTTDTLTYGKDHWYGSWIFFRYISEALRDPVPVRQILERVLDYDNRSADYSFSEIGDVLADRNTSFKRVFRDFTTSNLVRTVYPFRYREGAAYPELPRYLFPGDTTITDSLPRHASRYYQVPTSMLPNCGKILTVTLTSPDPSAELGADLVSYAYQGQQVTEIPFQPSVTLSGAETPDSLFIVVMNFGASGTTENYTLKVQSRAREAHYTLTDLGTIGSFGTMGPISNSGRAVGTLVSTGGGFTSEAPVTWQNGSVQYLGGDGYAFDISNNNDAIGWIWTPRGLRAHLWGSSGSRDLDTTASGSSIGYGVNDSGFAVGSKTFVGGNGIAQPTLWQNGVVTKLPLIPDTNAIGGEAHDINNKGQIIGIVYTTGSGGPQVLWNGGGPPTDIGLSGNLYHINDAGQYVGFHSIFEKVEGQVATINYCITGNGGGYSVVGMSDGTPGASFWGLDINNAGDVVGQAAQFAASGTYAFVYTHGVMHNLNEMLGFGTCWWLTNATGINDSGQICGVGYPIPFNLSNRHGFVLTPVTPTSVSTIPQLPSHYALYQNYPNPFNPTTTIQYDLPGQMHVQLELFDLLGRTVASLVDEIQQPGHFSVNFNASQLSTGVYFYRMKAGSFQDIKKLILVK